MIYAFLTLSTILGMLLLVALMIFFSLLAFFWYVLPLADWLDEQINGRGRGKFPSQEVKDAIR